MSKLLVSPAAPPAARFPAPWPPRRPLPELTWPEGLFAIRSEPLLVLVLLPVPLLLLVEATGDPMPTCCMPTPSLSNATPRLPPSDRRRRMLLPRSSCVAACRSRLALWVTRLTGPGPAGAPAAAPV